jgi:hypothetical protein
MISAYYDSRRIVSPFSMRRKDTPSSSKSPSVVGANEVIRLRRLMNIANARYTLISIDRAEQQ